MNLKNIKLIIWDLDETFWKGTLSEGGVQKCDNIELIKLLSNRGIVNSICSKNDKESAENKLQELGILNYFVFNSIDWTPKGPRIASLIRDIGLRAQNVLFIDDNIVNLNEAKHYNDELMIAEPSIIPELYDFFSKMEVSDAKHKRLQQYQILEKKRDSKNSFDNNLSFLYSTNTQVYIHDDCLNQIDRIYELVLRTNQLNYTKRRSTKEELLSILTDESVKNGYVTVKDKFGDYGIVGYFAVKENKLLHFLFSCRTIGQGVEQYVYSILKFPELTVIGNVVNMVNKEPAPSWINQNVKNGENCDDKRKQKTNAKIIFKGPCDMSIMVSYLNSDNIITEFTYTSATRNNYIEHHNHSINYLQFDHITPVEIKQLLEDCIFNDEEMFKTSIYDSDADLIFISSQIEPNLGIYRNKKTGKRIAFGEYCYPLTDKNNWDSYINKKIPTFDNEFTETWLKDFSNKYTFEGRESIDEYVSNLNELLTKISPNAKICILMGSEIPYEANTQKAYEHREIIYQELNMRLREFASKKTNVFLVNFTDFIHGQKDFLDNINHYQRHVYYEAAAKANKLIMSVGGNTMLKSRRYYFFENLLRKSLRVLHINSSTIMYINHLLGKK